MDPSPLISIDRWLAANRPVYYAALLPGATEDELDEFDTRLPARLPQSFRDLYRWRNGQPAGISEPLQDNRMFVSLADVASTKQELDGMIDTDFDDPRWWRRGWIPFLYNGGGDYLCLDLTAEDGGTPGQLLEFWHDAPDRRVKYPSIDAWVNDLAKSMELGTLKLT